LNTVVVKAVLSGRKEETTELSFDRSSTISFDQTSLSSFWLNVEDDHPMLSQKENNILFPLAPSACVRLYFQRFHI